MIGSDHAWRTSTFSNLPLGWVRVLWKYLGLDRSALLGRQRCSGLLTRG
jgi:hypothetical protein